MAFAWYKKWSVEILQRTMEVLFFYTLILFLSIGTGEGMGVLIVV